MTLALHVKGNSMIKQLATYVATMTLLVSSSGCSGMKNFLFGRGAACSTCAPSAPVYGVAPPMEPSCGYEPTCGHEPTCGFEPAHRGPIASLRSGCGLFNGQSVCNGSPGCNCGPSAQSYMPSGFDAYQGAVHDPYAHSGEVIGSQVMGDNYNGYPIQGNVMEGSMAPGVSYPGGTVQDNFDARGDRIINVNPLPGT
jgi:hypothetical protein